MADSCFMMKNHNNQESKNTVSMRKTHAVLVVCAATLIASAAAFYPYLVRASESGVRGVPAVALASTPLYAAGSRAKPTLTLALSVEFPTVGAAYRDAYSVGTQYIGYFDSNSCYRYNKQRDWFERYGEANHYACAGKGFSGNFMNWATTSAIDILRLGLTGGDRIQDEKELTVLQRAVIPSNFYRSSAYFPEKRISNAVARQALPDDLLKISQRRWFWEETIDHTGDVFIANCLNKVFFGSRGAGNCNNPSDNASLDPENELRRQSYFSTRVAVCESQGGKLTDPRGPAYCQRYPSGYYKPVGNLQKYSDRLRVAAFGYLMDSSRSRYGGVLRAPMKFVGPKNYSAAGDELLEQNAQREWNITTGVFIDNPENAQEGNSGVINYLNKFGRTGREGTYKELDPVGELYYESLRYLQGLPPTPQATRGMTSSMKDGFHVVENWTDPHAGGDPAQNYSCVRNNIVVIGDVNTHSDKSFPGNRRTNGNDFNRVSEVDLRKNIPNFVHWTEVVAGFEKNSRVDYVDQNGERQSTRSPNGQVFNMNANADTGSNSGSYYMAGAAYWANTHDIRGKDWTERPDLQRPGMRVRTYVIDVNEGGANSNYHTRKQRQFFLAAKYGGFTDNSGYGNPFYNSAGGVDNSSWARNPGSSQMDPRSYYLVSNAQSILDGLDEIFASVVAEANSIASGSVSSSELFNVDSAALFRGQFDVADWSGDVVAIALNRSAENGGAANVSMGAQVWSAANQLVQRNSSRNIIIGNSNRHSAVNFEWSAIEDSLQHALNGADQLGPQRLAFIAGDRSNEGGVFRSRGKLLGDVINSGVVYSGKPSSAIADADYYSAENSVFQTKKNRIPAVFVGANDGMLHAFNASTDAGGNGGEEFFAYIPSWVGSRLAALTDKSYSVNGHQSFVDATPAVAEAKVGNAWKTVLVGGTGAGGQGVYALDVSDPATFTKNNVMWEFTDEDDADLGNVVAQPQILKVRVANNAYKWFAVVAGGVNNYVADGHANQDASAAIFFLDLNKAYRADWELGKNYFKIRLPAQKNLAMASGIADFSTTLNAQGVLERIYAGDLQGNVWRINFNGLNVDAMRAPAIPLFIAADRAEKRQPITAAPTLFRAANRNLVVVVGTGKYLEEADNQSSQVQSFYALMDEGAAAPTTSQDSSSGAIISRARLKQAQQTTSGIAVAAPFAWATMPVLAADNSSGRNKELYAGWYYNLPGAGEKQVSAGQVYGTTVLANSIMPPAGNQGICGTGDSRSYTINVAAGKLDAEDSPVGLLGSPIVIDIDNAEYSALNSVGQRTRTKRSRAILQGSKAGSDGTAFSGELMQQMILGRLSWRQIPNYQELRHQSYDKFISK